MERSSETTESMAPPSPYGSDRLPEEKERKDKSIWIAKGASNAAILAQYAGFFALGLQGCDICEELAAEHVRGFTNVIIVNGDGTAGRDFYSGVLKRIQSFGLQCDLSEARMPRSINGPVELWQSIAGDAGGDEKAYQNRFRRTLIDSCLMVSVSPDAKKRRPELNWAATRLSEVDWKSIEWLWPSYLAVGKLHCVFGQGGVGKTFVVIQLIATLTTGRNWPDKAPGTEPGSVVFLTAEDGIEDTILPRLRAARADVSKVVVLDNLYEVNGRRHYFNLSDEGCLECLEIKLREIEDLKLVVIDPITAFLGGADSNKIGDVRSAMFPLTNLAARLGIAIVFIHHCNKASGQSAQNRASGSTAFIDGVRIAAIVCENPENPDTRRVVKIIKSNLEAKPPGIGYRVVPVPEFETALVEWEDEPIMLTETELMMSFSFANINKPSDAEAFLLDVLAAGERPKDDIMAEAEAVGLTAKEIRTARERLRLRTRKEGFGKNCRGYWRLPDKEDQNGDTTNTTGATDAHSHERARVGSTDEIKEEKV